MVGIIAFWTFRVKPFIVVLMVGLLKEYVCPYFGVTKATVILYGCCGDVNVDTSDGSVAVAC